MRVRFHCRLHRAVLTILVVAAFFLAVGLWSLSQTKRATNDRDRLRARPDATVAFGFVVTTAADYPGSSSPGTPFCLWQTQ